MVHHRSFGKSFSLGSMLPLLWAKFRSLDTAMPGAISEISPDSGCFLQAWSGYGIHWPLITHIFGIKPDAYKKEIHFTPKLPSSWDNFDLKNLRIGTNTIDIKCRKIGHELVLDVTSKEDGWNFTIGPDSGIKHLVVNGVEYDGNSKIAHHHFRTDNQHPSRQVQLTGNYANCTDADLRSAALSGWADLSDANITGTDLRDGEQLADGRGVSHEQPGKAVEEKGVISKQMSERKDVPPLSVRRAQRDQSLLPSREAEAKKVRQTMLRDRGQEEKGRRRE